MNHRPLIIAVASLALALVTAAVASPECLEFSTMATDSEIDEQAFVNFSILKGTKVELEPKIDREYDYAGKISSKGHLDIYNATLHFEFPSEVEILTVTQSSMLTQSMTGTTTFQVSGNLRKFSIGGDRVKLISLCVSGTDPSALPEGSKKEG